MMMMEASPIRDGFYYRDSKGEKQGPFASKEELLEQQNIAGAKGVWRERGGNVWKINVERKFTIGRIFSFNATGAAMELSLMCVAIHLLSPCDSPCNALRLT